MAHPKAGRPLSPSPVKYFAAVLFGEALPSLQPAMERLERLLGPADYTGPEQPFDMTDYYTDEMGGGLRRSIVSFERLGSPASLAWIKHETARIESALSVGGNRRLNIDSGYLDYFKVVLASFKEGPQKVYIGEGVYADPVLLYQDGAFSTLPWTFPDFKKGLYSEDFLIIRRLYKRSIRERAGNGEPDPLR